MTRPDLHHELTELAQRLPDPPPASLDAVTARARQRHRRRSWSLGAAAGVAVLLVAVAVGSLWQQRPTDPAAPAVGDAFGPVLAEIGTCPSELAGCPDLDVGQALDQIVDWAEREPALTVIETHTNRDAPDREGSMPATASVVVRIDRTPAADRILRDLVALPAVDTVWLGTADQTPAALRDAGMPSEHEDGRALGRVTVPVHGAEDPVVYEIWEPTPGTICFGRRPDATCTHLRIRTGQVAGRFTMPYNTQPGCLSVATGPGVDHVRVTATDGTSLEVATTALRPDLNILQLHVACWTDTVTGVISADLIGPEGEVIDQVQ